MSEGAENKQCCETSQWLWRRGWRAHVPGRYLTHAAPGGACCFFSPCGCFFSSLCGVLSAQTPWRSDPERSGALAPRPGSPGALRPRGAPAWAPRGLGVQEPGRLSAQVSGAQACAPKFLGVQNFECPGS